jgi:hypothetical protein
VHRFPPVGRGVNCSDRITAHSVTDTRDNEATGTMNRTTVTKRATILPVLAIFGLLSACASKSDKAVEKGGSANSGGASNAGDTATTGGVSGVPAPNDASLGGYTCPSIDPSYVCNPSGFAFAQLALAVSDFCSGPVAACALGASIPTGETMADLSQPDAGTICLSGVISPGGWAQLALAFSIVSPDGTALLKKFDANVLGISQLQFTIDAPPSSGLSADAAINTDEPCPSDAAACSTMCFSDSHSCFTYGFSLMIAPGSSIPLNITTPGTVIAPFANFRQIVNNHSFDTSAFDHMSWNLSSQGPFNFCIHDFKFLDALGNEVKP